jgi:hypothetical protein
MSDALEKRLRALVQAEIDATVGLRGEPNEYVLRLLREAARIGAEVERHACARVIDAAGFRLVADEIRARIHADERNR